VLGVDDGVAFFEFLHACSSSRGSVQAKAWIRTIALWP
jgi:hypothetical protein